jgi:dienelactone hydrolase
MNRSLSNRVSAIAFLLACASLLAFAAETPATRKDVDLTAADGAKLKASYFPAAKPGPGVLLLHQCNRDRNIWTPLAEQLSAAGFSVLTFDLRGFGESDGARMTKATPQEGQALRDKWPGDIDVAFQYLQSQPGVKRDMIGVGGASCGVNNSVQTALRHPEVHSLVLLSGSTDGNGRQYLRNAKSTPVFLAYADDDEFPDSIITIQWLYSVTGDPSKTLMHFPNGGHGADIFRAHPELMTEIKDWYVTTLIKTPGKAPAQKPVPVPANIAVLDTIEQPGGAAKVAAQYEKDRASAPKFDEQTVNFMAYERMQANDPKDAVEIARLVVLAYPDSPNAYDSLGDAYLADGQNDLALQSARKALELLPSDTKDPQGRRDLIKESAEGKVKQLQGDAR